MAARIERLVVAGVGAAVAGLALFVGLCGLRLPTIAAAAVALVAAVGGGVWSVGRLPGSLDGLWTRRPLACAAWALVALLAVGQTARQATYMRRPQAAAASVLPWDVWTVEHCCLTAYTESARLAMAADTNVYHPRHYRPTPEAPRQIDGFNVDVYLYPPPFLLLPVAVGAATGGAFLDVRAVWFGLSALALLLALAAVGARLAPEGRLRAVAVAPLVWLSLPVQVGLQLSNAQILIVAVSMLAWAAFARRPLVGSALLAWAIVAKLFPGLLGVWLLGRQRGRDAAWTAGVGIGLAALAVVVVGAEPFRDFVAYEMPRLSSGEAFEMLRRNATAVARNLSAFGIPLKLHELGVPGMTFAVGRAVSAVYTVLVVGLTVRAARRPARTPGDEAVVWLAVLSLATLASPFAPAAYVLTSLVWMACLDRRLPAAVVAVVWLAASVPLLVLSREVAYPVQLVAFLPAQAVGLGLPMWVLWRAGRDRAAGEPEAA